MAGFVKRWTKRIGCAGLVGIAALVGSYYVADRHLTQKYEHANEREAVTQGIEQLVQGAPQATQKLSPSYVEFLTKQGYWKQMKDVELNSYDVLLVEERGDERIAHYRVMYTLKKTGERTTNFGTFILNKAGDEWKIMGE